MRLLVLIAITSVGCAVVAGLADQASWLEAAANSFLPYLAVPLASGLLIRSARAAYGALAGAASSVALVAAFYGTTALLSPYAISLWGPVFWSVAGLVTGATLGWVAALVRPLVFARPRLAGAVFCASLVAAQTAVVVGPSIYSAPDLLALSVLVAYCCAIGLVALRIGRASWMRGPDRPRARDSFPAHAADGARNV